MAETTVVALGVLGLLILAAALFGPWAWGSRRTSSARGPSSAGGSPLFLEKFREDYPISDTRGIPEELSLAVAHFESGGGRGKAYLLTNNAYSIHAGAGDGRKNRYWRGRTHTTSQGEQLRVYLSLRDSISDFSALLAERPRFHLAYAAALSNAPYAFFQELERSGYAGSSTRYAAGLRARFGQLMRSA